MELATLTLKLSGQSANTVVKHNVTPPQLALYAYMHGEDCVQSLTVTGIKKDFQVPAEMNRLRGEFMSEHATKCLENLFPGRFPQLPTTFAAIGYDPAVLGEDNTPAYTPPAAKNQSEKAIMEKIKGAAAARKEDTGAVAKLKPVATQEAMDALDDTGAEDDDDAEDPLTAELRKLEAEDEEDE